MLRVETFSTAGYGRADRIAYWNDVATSTIGPLVIEALDDDSFSASMKRVCLRNCEILAPTSNPASIRTEPTGIESGILNLQVQLRGRTSTHYGDRVCTLECGDVMLFDPSCPSLLEFSEATQVIVIRLPIAESEAHVPGLRRLAGIPVRGNCGAGALLSGFVRMAWSQLEDEEDLGWADSFCDVIWPLVDMAYSDARATRPLTSRERRRGEVLAHIDAHLLDANLTAQRIAQDLAISARSVQIIFAAMGTTPSAYVQGRRLDHAAAQLVQIRRDAPITQIAFDSGFNDLSTFCRLFRRKFGVAPRDYRGGARRASV
jgi:AraC-like DNA-binding protein